MTILILRKNKIKSMQCLDIGTLMSCDHLWIGTMFGLNFVPYYCDEKRCEIINPNGGRKCKRFRAPNLKNFITCETKEK